MLTVRRDPQYVHTSLASLFAADAGIHRLNGVNLYVGTHEQEYLDCYRQHRHVVIHPMSPQAWAEVEPLTLGQRLCYNVRRAMQDALSAKGLLLLEDDVVFRDGFLQILFETVRDVEQKLGHANYVLAGYFSYDFTVDPAIQRTRLFTAYPCELFYGTQCMYFPRDALPRLIDYVSRHGFGPGHIPYDFVVKKFGLDLREEEAANDGIYACRRALVQHIGVVTTGLANQFHQTPLF